MAALLLASYTRPGDTMVSIGANPALMGAAGASGRTCLAINEPVNLAALAHLAGHVRLILLTWPAAHRGQPMAATEAVEFFAACRALMARDGCTIVVLTALAAGDDVSRQIGDLIFVADKAGLGWLQHILVMAAPSAERTVAWRHPHGRASDPRRPALAKVHVDLLVFTARPPRTRIGKSA
jgi:hypothetical protein